MRCTAWSSSGKPLDVTKRTDSTEPSARMAIVTFGEDGIEGGNRTAVFGAVARTFDQLGQTGENGGWITPRGRWLTDSQGDLPLCHGVAGQGVHDQQDLFSLIAEILGNGRGIGRALQPHQRAGIGGGGNDDRAPHALFAKNLFDEFFNFTAALADQSDHDDFGFGVARHHAEQHRLANAGAGKQPHALAAADRQQRIDRAYAHIERLVYGRPGHRVDGPTLQRTTLGSNQRTFVIQGAANAIEDPPQQFVANRTLLRTVDRATAKRWRTVDSELRVWRFDGNNF